MTVIARFTGFIGTPNGERRLVEGEPWADDDPFVLANPDAFTKLEPVGEIGPETVTLAKPSRVSTRREPKK